MNNHIYVEKIISGEDVKKEEKLDYMNQLTFDSNKFKLNNTQYDLNNFSNDLKSIISNSSNLYVYMDIQNCHNNRLSKDDYKNLYKLSIEHINNIFGNEKIILQSSSVVQLKNEDKCIKFFLIYCDNKNMISLYKNEQEQKLDDISRMGYRLKPWEYRNMLASMHQMQLYKVLYTSLFNNPDTKNLSNFIEDGKNDKVYGVGVIKKNPTTDKYDSEKKKYSVHQFKIENEYCKNWSNQIIFNFNIVAKVFLITEKSKVMSSIEGFGNNKVQMTVLGEVYNIPNFFDKKSITFDFTKYDDSKFHSYCESIKLLKQNNFTSIATSKIQDSYSIAENDTFYKNNINKKLSIGFVYQSVLKNKIDDYVSFFTNKLSNKNKPLWINENGVDIKTIELEDEAKKPELIKKLIDSGCDVFLCFTNIKTSEKDNEDICENVTSITENPIYDYYKLIKQHIVEQNITGNTPLITQGVYVPLEKESDEDHNEEEDFPDKVKTLFYELCTKYIFYNNKINITTDVQDNEYAVISFDSKEKLFSFIKVNVLDNIISISKKELIRTKCENANSFKKDEHINLWLSNHINDSSIAQEILKNINRYDDFIIYDFTNKSFLVCSSPRTYLLSDEQYDLRKELILKHRTGNTYIDNKGQVKKSTAIMSLLLPLYNISKTLDRQIFIFEIDNELYYFVGNDISKKSMHPQSPLVKMYFNQNNKDLMDFYFALITSNVVRNSQNTKTTLLEKFSKIHMIN